MDSATRAFHALGLTDSATADEVNQAFHRVALVCHPDKGGDEEMFKEIQSARMYLLKFWNFQTTAAAHPPPPPQPQSSSAAAPPPPPQSSSWMPSNNCNPDKLLQEKDLAMQEAVQGVLQRPPHWAGTAATATEKAFYRQLVCDIHAEINWVGKVEIKHLLYKEPWSSHCNALWARVKPDALPPPPVPPPFASQPGTPPPPQTAQPAAPPPPAAAPAAAPAPAPPSPAHPTSAPVANAAHPPAAQPAPPPAAQPTPPPAAQPTLPPVAQPTPTPTILLNIPGGIPLDKKWGLNVKPIGDNFLVTEVKSDGWFHEVTGGSALLHWTITAINGHVGCQQMRAEMAKKQTDVEVAATYLLIIISWDISLSFDTFKSRILMLEDSKRL